VKAKYKVHIAILFLFISKNIYSQKSAKEIYDENNSSVVYIQIYDKYNNPISSGSGFVIDEDGLIATNYHVIENAFFAKALFSDESVADINYVYGYDKKNDLAILKVFHSLSDKVDLISSKDVEIGDICFAIGSPEGIVNTISDGIVSNIHRDNNNYIIQITNPISHGSSGGALFDDNGKLIGITVSTIKEGQNLNFAVPSDYLISLHSDLYDPLTFKQFQSKEFNYKGNYTKESKPPKTKEKAVPKEPEAEIISNNDVSSFSYPDNTSYDFNFNYNFQTTALTKNFPSQIKFENGYSAFFSYWASNYVALNIGYQNNNIINQIDNKKIKLSSIKGEILFRTSEENLRVLIGFGLGMANTEFKFVDNGTTNENSKVVTGSAENYLLLSSSGGMEYRFINNASVQVIVPFDYIMLKENEFIGYISPSLGINILF